MLNVLRQSDEKPDPLMLGPDPGRGSAAGHQGALVDGDAGLEGRCGLDGQVVGGDQIALDLVVLLESLIVEQVLQLDLGDPHGLRERETEPGVDAARAIVVPIRLRIPIDQMLGLVPREE